MSIMFQQRHFEAIARTMQRAYPLQNDVYEQRNAQWNQTVSALAYTFECDNPLFNRERFIAACQPGANVRARSHRAA
jgi:hypothetical protein